MAKSSALVSSKLERSAIAKSLLVWTVMGEDRVSGFSNLGFFGISTPSVTSFIYKKNPMMNDPEITQHKLSIIERKRGNI